MLTEFLHYLKIQRNYSKATITAYSRDLQDLAEYLLITDSKQLFEEGAVQTLEHRSLRNWVGDLATKDISHRSIKRKLAAVRAFFTYLKKKGKITHNPIASIKLPKTDSKLPVFLKEAETEILFEEVIFPETFEGARDKCLLEILYGCGLRRSEIQKLQFADIDFYTKILRISGKGNKTRIVPFGNHVYTAMEVYRQKSAELGLNLSGTFFVKIDNQALYDKLIYRIVQKYLPMASNVSRQGPHVLRHTYATHLLNAGADLNDIKELLGHSSLAATQIYTHNSISKLQNIHKMAHPRAINPQTQ